MAGELTPAPLLEIDDVHIGFDGIRVLNGLRLSLQPGELRCLIGPNGAGKTTLLDIVSGMLRPHRGHVRFAGHDVRHMQPQQLVHRGLGRKFQTPAVFPSLSVRQNLECAGSSRDAGLRLLWPAAGVVRERVEEVLDLTGLVARADDRAGVLSHGQQQWLEIGMLLMHDPKLLLLDEPVAGLTRAERERTADLLRSVHRECAVLIVEHDMAFVRQLESTVTVLHQGSVLVEGPMELVQNDARVIEVYLGKSDSVATESEKVGV
jgi:urea transport system ATP-binding protein